MNCTEVKNRLDKAANSADADGLAADSAFRSHFDACPSCRREFVAARRLLEFVARQKATAAAMPDEELQATRSAILRAVTEREHRAPRALLPIWLTDSLLASAPALAAFAVIVLGIVELRRGIDRPVITPVAVVQHPQASPARPSSNGRPSHSTSTKPSAAASSGSSTTAASEKTLSERLMSLPPEARIEALKKLCKTQFPPAVGGTAGAILAELRSLAEDTAVSRKLRIDAYQALAEANNQNGDLVSEMQAFGNCLDLDEEENGKEHAATLAWQKARWQYDFQHAQTDAMRYCDLITTRYPESGVAEKAWLLGGRYYEYSNAFPQALAQYRAVRASATDPNVIDEVRKREWFILLKMNRCDEAFVKLQEIQTDSTDPQQKAYARFFMGWVRYTQGPAHFPAALREFNALIQELPQSSRAAEAKRLVCDIKSRILSDVAGKNSPL